MALGVVRTVGEQWTLLALGLGRTAGESGAGFSDTLSGGGILAVDFKWSEDFSTGAVIGALSQLEDSTAALPIPAVDSHFGYGEPFHFGLVGIACPGLGPEISYRSDNWELTLGGSFQKRRYHLDNRAGPTSEGIGQEISFAVFASVR